MLLICTETRNEWMRKEIEREGVHSRIYCARSQSFLWRFEQILLHVV